MHRRSILTFGLLTRKLMHDMPKLYLLGNQLEDRGMGHLTKAYLGFDHPIPPDWVRRLGERCPKLVTFSLHDPRWIGTEVSKVIWCFISPR